MAIGRNLKDRKVVQWAIAYVAGAWLILQVLDVLADVWSLSLLFQRGTQIFLVAGLFVTISLAWYHGEKGRQRVSGPELLIIGALLGIAAALTGFLAGGESDPIAGTDAVGISPIGAPASSLRPRGPVERDPEGPSIAVLPFADLSPAGDQQYFADGVAEEILNALARLPGIKVAGRTSSFMFRGQAADIPTIGEQLGVRHVLEGSLRTQGTRIRITAQLTSVEDGFNVWSDDYDRELEGVFSVQQDIAREIVDALQVELGGRLVEETWASQADPEAYEAYLRGRQAISEMSGEGTEEALNHFARAVSLDSTFAHARGGLAGANYLLWFFNVRPIDRTIPIARREATRALEQNPEIAGPYTVLGLIALYVDWDWEEAERQILRALELNPNEALARHAYGDLLTILGDPEGGLRQVQLGREADPLSVLASGPAAFHLAFLGRFEEMIDQIGHLREIFPDRPRLGDSFLALGFWHLGRTDEALDIYRTMWQDEPDLALAVEAAIDTGGPRSGMRAWADYLAGDARRVGGSAVDIARLYARGGSADEAFEWLDAAFEDRRPALLHAVGHPDFASLHEDPRFQALLDRLGIAEPD